MKRRKLEPIIVETSLKLFIEKGYDKVSVVDICNACDITKPTFYKYATSKGDLLRFYFPRIPATFADDWDDLEKSSSALACIKNVIIGFLEYFMSYGLDLCTQLYVQNIATEQDTFSLPDEFLARLEAVFKAAQDNGEILNQAPAAVLRDAALNLMIGYGGYWILFNGQKDAVAEFKVALDNLLEPAQVQK